MILEEKFIEGKKGVKLKLYLSEKGLPHWLIVTHGVGEYALRHNYLRELFSESFNILFYDLRGHGESEGKRAYVDSFDDFCEDLKSVLNFLKEEYDCKSYALLGHSMGGLITSRYMQKYVDKNFYPKKVFLSSPAVSGSGILGSLFHYGPHFLINNLAALPKSFPLKGILDLKKISHDQRVYNNYISDPKNILALHSKLLFELVKASKDTFSKPLRVNCDLYVSIGTEDKFVNPNIVIKYFSEIEKNAVLNIVEGGYHELHNEVEKYKKIHLNFLKESLLSNLFYK